MIHYANIKTSKRLQDLKDFLLDGHEHTTFEICKKLNDMAVSTSICELRKNGYDIIRKYKGKSATGRQINTYQLM